MRRPTSNDEPDNAGHKPAPAFVVVGLAAIDLILLLKAFTLGIHFEATARSIADSARGQRIAVMAGPALIAAVVSIFVRNRRTQLIVLVTSALATVGAVVAAL
ncbi:MAG: hypothetical protein ABIR32_09400 [Ilumatobacteraceae bacterium]